MRTVLTILIAALVCVACIGGPAFAQLTPTEWTALGETTSWFEAANWDPAVPDENYHATIPHNPDGGSVWPVIDDTEVDAEAGKLTITVSGSTRGTLNINEGSTLILGNGTQTSTIDGDLTVGESDAPAYLEILDAHTILGSGGKILLQKLSQVNPATASGDSLTIGSSAPPCATRGCSILVHGSGIINVELDNRAYVVGDTYIRLADNPKTGSSAGFWIAEDAGTLDVQCNVTGASAWVCVEDEDCLINLEAELGCVSGSGPMTLEAGELVIGGGASFCTTGVLTWRSVCTDGQCTGTTSPTITVSAGTATFGDSSCSACP